MTTRTLVSTDSPFERSGAYSRAVIQEPWCFLSGTTGYDYSTMAISPDVVEQTEQILRTVRGVLQSRDFELADVVRVTCVVADQGYWPAVYRVLGETFRDIRPALLTYVAPLIEPAMKVELQMTALRRSGTKAQQAAIAVGSAASAFSPEQRLHALGLTLPPVPQPIANYVPYRISGNCLYLSGQVPRSEDRGVHAGRVGQEVTIEEARRDAQLVGQQLLAVAKAALGNLDRITAVLKLFGMVNAGPDFADHPKVIDGCSNLLVDVLGAAGRHARSAIGMGSLPSRATVEIEAILEFA